MTTRPTGVNRAGVPGTVAASRKSSAAKVTPAMKRTLVSMPFPSAGAGARLAATGTGMTTEGTDVVAGATVVVTAGFFAFVRCRLGF
jgi:hypothetical protein